MKKVKIEIEGDECVTIVLEATPLELRFLQRLVAAYKIEADKPYHLFPSSIYIEFLD